MVQTINPRNRKAQFFIASAIIITAVITLVFHYVTTIERIDSPSLISSDETFYFTSIRNEYEQVADYSLAVVSKEAGAWALQEHNLFSEVLANFTSFVQNLSNQKGMRVDVAYGITEASNTTMNASLNITFLTVDTETILNSFAVSSINVSINTNEITQQLCDFNFTVREEYEKPITSLSNNFPECDACTPNFEASVNGSKSACTFTNFGPGKYESNCPETGCANTLLKITVTDFRNILGFDTYTT